MQQFVEDFTKYKSILSISFTDYLDLIFPYQKQKGSLESVGIDNKDTLKQFEILKKAELKASYAKFLKISEDHGHNIKFL